MTTTEAKRPYMCCYFNSSKHQKLCAITEKEFDVLENILLDEYGHGYYFKEPLDKNAKEMHGLISFGITKYGKDRCSEGLETWTSLNEQLHEQIWELLKNKTNYLRMNTSLN